MVSLKGHNWLKLVFPSLLLLISALPFPAWNAPPYLPQDDSHLGDSYIPLPGGSGLAPQTACQAPPKGCSLPFPALRRPPPPTTIASRTCLCPVFTTLQFTQECPPMSCELVQMLLSFL